jgi:hypothetical protein
MGVAFWHGITGITSITQRCGGLWRFLIVRARGRTAIELERERNRATATAIQLLPSDADLLEYEPEGRLRVIRKRGPATTTPTVIGEVLPGPSGELDR